MEVPIVFMDALSGHIKQVSVSEKGHKERKGNRCVYNSVLPLSGAVRVDLYLILKAMGSDPKIRFDLLGLVPPVPLGLFFFSSRATV